MGYVGLELQDLFVYSSDILCKSPSFPIGFLYRKVRRITGAHAWHEPARPPPPPHYVILCDGLIPASPLGLKG